MVILWTDALFFTLLAGLGLVIYRASQKEHLRRPWRKVFASTSAMVSLTVLCVYLLFAILDSIHYHPQNSQGSGNQFKTEAISVLDSILNTARTQTEKSYSAPFASYGFSKESLMDESGKTQWSYPRLRYGAQHLQHPERDKPGDILATSIKGFGLGLLSWSIIVFGLLIILSPSHTQQDFKEFLYQFRQAQDYKPIRGMLYTVLGVLIIGFISGLLSQNYHILGTDKVGTDVFYQSLKSIRTGVLIGTLTTFVTLPLALTLGIMAGYFKGWIDDIIQYIYTTLNSIPDVLLIAASMLLMQAYIARHETEFASLALRADFRLLFLCMILGMTSWTGLCRLLRAETLKLREMEYVQAAQTLGASQANILIRHILPNVFHLVLISVVLDFSSLVLAEAVLSYINIGVDPATESWGNMINSARLEMARDPVVWWSLSSAFVFMFTLVLAANLFADKVRDAFDPRYTH